MVRQLNITNHAFTVYEWQYKKKRNITLKIYTKYIKKGGKAHHTKTKSID